MIDKQTLTLARGGRNQAEKMNLEGGGGERGYVYKKCRENSFGKKFVFEKVNVINFYEKGINFSDVHIKSANSFLR